MFLFLFTVYFQLRVLCDRHLRIYVSENDDIFNTFDQGTVVNGHAILALRITWNYACTKVLMQGKLFQWCTHLLYSSVLSLTLGGNVNTIRMSQPDMGSIFHINNLWNILVIGNYYVNHQNFQNSMKYFGYITGFNMYAGNTQQQLTFLTLLSWTW